jgi:16S rRNA (uracil1498-N3)-methyltransferase
MPDLRAYCQPTEQEPATLVLNAEESHHLVAVNRAKVGDTVVVFDGRGREWICELHTAHRKAAGLKVRFAQRLAPLPHTITLAQALPKGGAMDAIVRKATEIGAARIVPLDSERTQEHLGDERADRKREKWAVAALEAAKQCGNPWLPLIEAPAEAAAFLAAPGDYDLRLIASLQPDARSLKSVLADYQRNHGRPPAKVLWAVGPEGDFTPAELSIARGAGFHPITLGPLVLRCETAAVYALSILSYELSAG